jgi:hypothetical protein
MEKKRIYPPFPIIYGDRSIGSFNGIQIIDSKISFVNEETREKLIRIFKENNANTMEINSTEVTLHPIRKEFILTDSLSIGEHTLGSKKKSKKKRKLKKKRKSQRTKTIRPTKKKRVRKSS